MSPTSARNGPEPEGENRTPAKLVVVNGQLTGRVYPLPQQGDFSIGRAETNDLTLRDTEVSRRHCKIVADGGTYRIRDLGSFNGSFVDGRRIDEAPLDSGTKLRLGQTRFALVLPDDTRPMPAVAVGRAAPADKPREDTRPPRVRKSKKRVIATAAVIVFAAVGTFLYARPGLRFFASRTRSIQVSSVPAGAEVFLDNRFVGLSPIELEITTAEPHTLRLAERGYQTWRTAIGRDTPRETHATLAPEPAATLLVSASKPDTEVVLDGRFVGKTGKEQPLSIPNVGLGQHELRLLKPNYVPYRARIDVTRAGSLRIHGKLISRQESSLLSLIAKEPDSALLYTELGHLRMVNKEFDKAMAAYKKALELVYSGNDTSRYQGQLRGEIQKVVIGDRGLFRYGTAEDTQVACDKLEDVLVSLVPRYRSAQAWAAWLADHYSKQKQVDNEIRLRRKLLAVQPQDLSLYYRVAALHMSKDEPDEAIALLKQALDKRPETWGLHYSIGQAYCRRAATALSAEDKRLAIVHLEKALGLCTSPRHKANIQHYLTRIQELKIP